MNQIKLYFETQEGAIAYAKAHNYEYEVIQSKQITRSKKSITSDKVLEFNKIINSIANYFLFNDKKKFKFFIFGILFRIFKNALSIMYLSFRKNIYRVFMVFFLF